MSLPSELAPLSQGRQRRVLSILVFSVVLIWLDATILGIALERLADPAHGLGASPGELQWAVGSYSLVFATVLFAAGALGDRYGHRTILIAGMATFGLASVWAAWSGSPTELIVARGLMGAGGAMIMPASMSIITWTFPPERRPGAIAAWSASSGVGLAGGPLLGGILLDHFWWGSVFLVNLPIVALGLIGIALFVPNPISPRKQSGDSGAPPRKEARRRRFDPVGVVLSTAGLLALAYGLIEGGQASDWGRLQVWGSIVTGIAILAAFLVAELRSAEPSFDPRLFADKRFAAGNFALGAMFFAITGQMFYGNFYLQGTRAMSAFHTGLMFLPGAIGVIIGAPLGARLVRRYGVGPIAGSALAVAALTFVTNLLYTVDTPLVWFGIVGAIGGIAIGATVAPTTAAVIGALPMERIGAGSAVNNTVRQVGSVLGIAVLGTIMSSAYRHGIGPALTGLPDQSQAAARPSAEATRHVATVIDRADLIGAANRAFVHAMHVTAAWAAVVAIIGAIALVAAFRARISAPGLPAQAPPTTAATRPVQDAAQPAAAQPA